MDKLKRFKTFARRLSLTMICAASLFSALAPAIGAGSEEERLALLLSESVPESGEAEFSGFLISLNEDAEPVCREGALERVAEGIYKTDDPAEMLLYGLVTAEDVELIEPDWRAEAAADDDIYSSAALAQIYGSGGARGQMRASAAASLGLDGSGVRVAIIDNGLDLDFGDFDPAKVERCAVNGNTVLFEPETGGVNHGTLVADIIAGANGNAIGVDGIAPGASIVSINVYSDGECYYSDIIAGLDAAINQYGCKVVNMSLGGTVKSDLLQTKLDEAVSKGVILVAAAGNITQLGNKLVYPAACDGVVGVGAVGCDYSWQTYSCYNVSVDCAVPGTLVYVSGGSYIGARGTSYASPAVAAAAAVMLQRDPGLTPAGFEAQLTARCMDLGASGRDDYYGCGFVRLDWLLSDLPVLWDMTTADNATTLSVAALSPELRVYAARYSAAGRLESVIALPGSFCRRYERGSAAERLFFLGTGFQPLAASAAYPPS